LRPPVAACRRRNPLWVSQLTVDVPRNVPFLAPGVISARRNAQNRQDLANGWTAAPGARGRGVKAC